ncbi:MAG: hypothetical protein PCFJNLEI_02346 [Verrucomicrobiae bacterium]|nr:hypothetical protein [Verrucomicrobiae bacterium]
MIKWLWLLALATAVSADLIRLTDGTEVEGEILAETATNLTIEVRLAGGTIFSTKVIPKSDVASFTRWTPEQRQLAAMQRGYLALAKYTPAEDSSASLAACDQAIGELQQFLSTYPESSHTQEIKDRLAQWQAERQQVAAGMVKIGGVWLTKEESEKRQARTKAQALMKQGADALAARQYALAVRAFDAVIALQAGGVTEVLATRQVTEALKGLRFEVTAQLSRFEAELAAAQQRFDRAKQARETRAPTQSLSKSGTGDGKLGTGPSSELLRAQSDYPAAEANLKTVQTQTDRLRNQLAVIDRRLGENAPAPATAAAPAEPAPSGDVLDATASWWKDNWLMFTGVAVVLLWLLSRIVGR